MELFSLRELPASIGFVFRIVIWSEFRTRKYRDDDHQEDPPHFSFSRKLTIFSVTSHQVVIWLMKLKKSTSTIGLKILLVLEINLLLFNFIEFIYLFTFLILDWSRSADRHWVLSIKKNQKVAHWRSSELRNDSGLVTTKSRKFQKSIRRKIEKKWILTHQCPAKMITWILIRE